ncbi:hypothetical protein M0802_004181 [Mischocyttarus mexicanus]|nr:hypothetical protein M0802_004181 [Mischocyttarus mexicanus]
MLRKRVKYPKGWTLLDENIKNVERVSLDPETQRKLGCTVGEYVFLEYPWVYVSRDDVLRLSNQMNSCLEPYKDLISVYNGTSFLFGYDSTELNSNQFVICLTEETRDVVHRRNRNISKAILNGVYEQIQKIPRFWKSFGSEDDLESTAENTRELLEIEINLPITLLGLNRFISDRDSGESRDSYIDLVPANETFDNISKLLVSRATQTHLQPRDSCVQTYPGNPRNAWTQYIYEDTLNGQLLDLKDVDNIEKSCDNTEQVNEDQEELIEIKQEESKIDIVREKEPIEIFLDKYSQQMIEEIKYNAVVNLYIDDIKNLKNDKQEMMKSIETPIFREYDFFLNLNIIQSNVIVSDISWHPNIMDLVIVSYIKSSDVIPSLDSSTGALLWSLSDTLKPLSYLRSNEDIHCISFCPLRENIVIGGSENGHLIIWDIPIEIINFTNTTNNSNCKSNIFELSDRSNVPVVNVTTKSLEESSHKSLIRKIKWIPRKFQAKSNGKFVKSLHDFNDCQLITISLDGIIIIWTIDLSSDLLNDCLRIIYKLSVPIPNDSRNFTLLCVGISLENFEEECNNVNRKVNNEFDRKEEEYMKRLWLGTLEGELVRCTWEGQMFDVGPSDSEECNFLDRSFAHDGPVIEIVRCHRMLEVILTIGGHIFAIWNENYLISPIFSRKSKVFYTACCWSCQPGVFFHWQTGRALTVLSFCKRAKESFGFIGIGDDKGTFRVFKEPDIYLNDSQNMDWFEKYIFREVQRKEIFSNWQREFLETNPIAIAKRLDKEDQERKKRLEEAKENLQKEYEQRLRLEAEIRASKVPKSKETIWKLKEQERMRSVLLKKKGFVPVELERQKLPLVRLKEEKHLKLLKIEKEINIRKEFYQDIVTLQIPEMYNSFQTNNITEDKVDDENTVETNMEIYMQQYYNIRDEGLGILCMAFVSPAYVGASHWFLFVATTAFIITLLWVFIYLLSIREVLKIPINWILTELLNTAIDTVLYLIAFIAQLSLWSAVSNSPHSASNITGGVRINTHTHTHTHIFI